MTDEQLRAFVPDLVRWEGSTTWLYRDTLGYATIGIGNLVHDADEAIRLPFQVWGVDAGRFAPEREATPGEIQREFLRVIAMPRGRVAATYRDPSPAKVELTDDGVLRLAVGRLRSEFLPGLSRLFVGFEDLPTPAQSCLVDLAWNLGIRGLAQFGHLREAVAQRRWARPPGDMSPGPFASESCHVKTSREDRNQWRAAKFLETAAGAPS